MEDMTPPLLRFWMSSRYISICRICLTETSDWSSLHRPLYIRTEGFRGTMTIKNILILLFQTKNYEDKSFPQCICDTCLETVLRFFTFWQLCRKTESQLTKQVKVLSKRVAILHSNIVKNKKSRYKGESSAILYLNRKKIDYFNPDRTDCKFGPVHEYVNRTGPNNVIMKPANTAKTIQTIKDCAKHRVKTYKNSSLNYHCDYCPESFAERDQLVGHLKFHHKIFDVAECADCGKKFKTIKLLKKHFRTHKEANYKCSICDEDFQSTANLETHISGTHAELKSKCAECNKMFKKDRDLSIHQWNTHGYEYYCKVCGKKFKNYYTVKAHEEAHDGYDCDNCAQKFNSKIKLKQHLMTCLQIGADYVSEFEMYICDFCKKTFFRKATLRQHILNLHLFPKRFKCAKCDKRVSTKTQLDAHMVVHTRKRTEQCKICYNYFVTKYALTYHMRLHTGERPYQCSKCDEKFLSASRRMAHVKRKHIGRTEQCSICSSSFYSGYALKRHMQRHFDPNSTLFENNSN